MVERALVAAASLFLVLALVVGYVQRAAVDSDQFANRAAEALRDDAVRTVIAEKVTDEVVLKQEADLIAVRPVIESVTSAIVGSRAFTGLFRAAIRDVHRAVFDRNEDTVTLTVADVGTVLQAALLQLRPKLAAQVESTGRIQLLKRDAGAFSTDLIRIADKIRLLAPLLLLVALLLVAAALFVSGDRRQTVVHLGVGAAAAGVLLVVAYGILRSLAVDHLELPEDRAAAGAVWDAFLGDLRGAAWILAGSGAVIAAAAASLLKPIDVGVPLRRVAGWITTEPERPVLRAPARGDPAGRRAGRDPRARRRDLARADARGRVPDLRGRERDPAAHLQAAGPERRTAAGASVRAPRRAAAADRVRDRGGGDRRDNRGVRRVGRHERRGPRRRPVQRPCRAVRPPPRQGRPAGDAQRDVGPAARLVLVRAGPSDSEPAGGRRPQPADRHPLRRPARERPAAHGLHQPGGAHPGRRQRRGGGGRESPPQQARLLRRGRKGDVPLPHVLRAGRHPARVDTRRHPRLPRVASRRGRRDRQSGLPDPRGLRGGREQRGTRGPRLHPARERALGDACAR